MEISEKPEGSLSQGDTNPPVEETSKKTTLKSNEGIETEVNNMIAEDTVRSESPAGNLSNLSPSANETDSDQQNSQYSGNIRRVLDISLPVTVSFGTANRSLSEVLKLAPGILLELDKAAEDPVVLKVNNKVFAWGRVVDVDGYYGVEITDIMTQVDRIVSLGEAE